MGKRYWYLDFDHVGFNFRMTDAQAAVGLVQLAKLEGFNARRTEIANLYCERLRGIRGLTTPYVSPDVKHVFHIYCVLVEPEFPLEQGRFHVGALHRRSASRCGPTTCPSISPRSIATSATPRANARWRKRSSTNT